MFNNKTTTDVYHRYAEMIEAGQGETIKKFEARNVLHKALKNMESSSQVSQWVAAIDDKPTNSDQVFVKYENGKYGINEYWSAIGRWIYQFDGLVVEKWCKPPCD